MRGAYLNQGPEDGVQNPSILIEHQKTSVGIREIVHDGLAELTYV